MDERVYVSTGCLDAMPRGRHLRASAQGVSADGKAVWFNPAAAVYVAHRERLERCGRDAPPTPVEQWPAWARAIAKRRQPGEVGVGSTFERMTGRLGKRFVAMMKRRGADCGCARRKVRWDALFAY